MGEMILLSGRDDERTIQEALSRGAKQYISPHLAPDRNDQFGRVLVIGRDADRPLELAGFHRFFERGDRRFVDRGWALPRNVDNSAWTFSGDILNSDEGK